MTLTGFDHDFDSDYCHHFITIVGFLLRCLRHAESTGTLSRYACPLLSTTLTLLSSIRDSDEVCDRLSPAARAGIGFTFYSRSVPTVDR
jgi:hypothetical protein